MDKEILLLCTPINEPPGNDETIIGHNDNDDDDDKQMECTRFQASAAK